MRPFLIHRLTARAQYHVGKQAFRALGENLGTAAWVLGIYLGNPLPVGKQIFLVELIGKHQESQ